MTASEFFWKFFERFWSDGRMIEVKWILFCVLMTSVSSLSHANPEQQELIFQSINDSEVILKAETLWRKFLIVFLSNVKLKTVEGDEFHSGITELLQDLETRKTNPLVILKDETMLNMQESFYTLVAETLVKLKNCSDPNALDKWMTFLISAEAPPTPNLDLTAFQIQSLKTITQPYVNVVLVGIQKNRLQLSKSLLENILYNYQFRPYSPDLTIILENVNGILESGSSPLENFKISASITTTPNKILSSILEFVSLQSNNSILSYQITHLLSALSDEVNIADFETGQPLWSWLNVITHDDYPPDIVAAKDELATAIKNGKIGLNLTEIEAYLKGYPPAGKLLGLVSKLTVLPNENPLSVKVHAIYPHVKLRYLAINQKYFKPQTTADIVFLLKSFFTTDNEANSLIINKIQKVLLTAQFYWQEIVSSFDFSRYSKPRSLVMDVLQELLNKADEIEEGSRALLSYFLRYNSLVSQRRFSQGEDNAKLKTPILPMVRKNNIPVTSQLQDISINTAASQSATVLPMNEKCSEGPSTKIVDPESIVEIINSDSQNTQVLSLIRNTELPAEKFQNINRVTIFRSILLATKKRDHRNEKREFVINQMLESMPVNQKGNLPPRFKYKCSAEIRNSEPKEVSNQSPSEMDSKTEPSILPENLVNSTPLPTAQPLVMLLSTTQTSPPPTLVVDSETSKTPDIVTATTTQPKPSLTEPFQTSQVISTASPPLSACDDPISIIEPNSITQIAEKDTNYEKIKSYVLSEPLLQENYKALPNREEILKAVLREKQKASADSVEQLEISQMIATLTLTPDGQLAPLILQKCPVVMKKNSQEHTDCPLEKIRRVVDTSDIIEIMLPVEGSQIVKDLLKIQPIFPETYGHYPTRREVYKAVIADRGRGLQKDYAEKLNAVVEKIQLKPDAELPPKIIEICENTWHFVKSKCKDTEKLEKLIDPFSLFEIIDNKDVAEVEYLLFKEPILAEEYLPLGNRMDILLYFLRQHYAGFEENATDPERLSLSSRLLINKKGDLPPIVREDCIQSIVPLPTQSSKINTVIKAEKLAPGTLQPCTNTSSISRGIIDNSQTEQSFSPLLILQPRVEQPDTCQSNEILAFVYNPDSILEALSSAAPNASFISNQIKIHLIQYDQEQKKTKAEVLNSILNKLLDEFKDEPIRKDINILKTYILFDGPGQQEPPVIRACVPKSALIDRFKRQNCKENETLTSLLNTESIFEALAPDTFVSPYVRDKIKSYFVPIDASEKYKKGPILMDILNNLESGTENSTIKATINETKKNVLMTGKGAEIPDTIDACLPKTLIQKVQSTGSVTLPFDESFAGNKHSVVQRNLLQDLTASDSTPSVADIKIRLPDIKDRLPDIRVRLPDIKPDDSVMPTTQTFPVPDLTDSVPETNPYYTSFSETTDDSKSSQLSVSPDATTTSPLPPASSVFRSKLPIYSQSSFYPSDTFRAFPAATSTVLQSNLTPTPQPQAMVANSYISSSALLQSSPNLTFSSTMPPLPSTNSQQLSTTPSKTSILRSSKTQSLPQLVTGTLPSLLTSSLNLTKRGTNISSESAEPSERTVTFLLPSVSANGSKFNSQLSTFSGLPSSNIATDEPSLRSKNHDSHQLSSQGTEVSFNTTVPLSIPSTVLPDTINFNQSSSVNSVLKFGLDIQTSQSNVSSSETLTTNLHPAFKFGANTDKPDYGTEIPTVQNTPQSRHVIPSTQTNTKFLNTTSLSPGFPEIDANTVQIPDTNILHSQPTPSTLTPQSTPPPLSLLPQLFRNASQRLLTNNTLRQVPPSVDLSQSTPPSVLSTSLLLNLSSLQQDKRNSDQGFPSLTSNQSSDVVESNSSIVQQPSTDVTSLQNSSSKVTNILKTTGPTDNDQPPSQNLTFTVPPVLRSFDRELPVDNSSLPSVSIKESSSTQLSNLTSFSPSDNSSFSFPQETFNSTMFRSSTLSPIPAAVGNNFNESVNQIANLPPLLPETDLNPTNEVTVSSSPLSDPTNNSSTSFANTSSAVPSLQPSVNSDSGLRDSGTNISSKPSSLSSFTVTNESSPADPSINVSSTLLRENVIPPPKPPGKISTSQSEIPVLPREFLSPSTVASEVFQSPQQINIKTAQEIPVDNTTPQSSISEQSTTSPNTHQTQSTEMAQDLRQQLIVKNSTSSSNITAPQSTIFVQPAVGPSFRVPNNIDQSYSMNLTFDQLPRQNSVTMTQAPSSILLTEINLPTFDMTEPLSTDSTKSSNQTDQKPQGSETAEQNKTQANELKAKTSR